MKLFRRYQVLFFCLHCVNFVSFITVTGAGCSSKPLKRPSEWEKLPEGLSEEMKKRFEINQTPSPLLSPEGNPPSRVLGTPIQKKRGRKKAKNQPFSPMLTSPAPEAFTYPHRRVFPGGRSPFQVGEKLTYAITYLGLSAGTFTLEVLPCKWIRQRKVYLFQGKAVSSSVFSLFYRLEDVVESHFDFEGLFSHRFHLVLNEAKQLRDSLELNDSENRKTLYWNRIKKPPEAPPLETQKEAPIEPFSQDSLSALYYTRGLDWKIEGTVHEFPVVSEGDYWVAVGTFMRRETLRSSVLGTVPTLVIRPQMKYSGILKQQGGESFLWLTEDADRVPVRFEARVKIGTVVAQLTAWERGTESD